MFIFVRKQDLGIRRASAGISPDERLCSVRVSSVIAYVVCTLQSSQKQITRDKSCSVSSIGILRF